MKKFRSDVLLVIVFVLLGVLSRTIWHLGANIEFVTGLTLLATWSLNKRELSLVVPIAIMIISDILIGNTMIFIFTWSGFLFSAVAAIIINRLEKSSKSRLQRLSNFLGAGILSTIVFYLWTNFGVVMLTEMYTKNFSGIMQSYVNALPFLKNQLVGNLVILTTIFVGKEILGHIHKKIVSDSAKQGLSVETF